jgi:protein-tyrosine phosphatase
MRCQIRCSHSSRIGVQLRQNTQQDYLDFTKRLYHEAAGGLNTVVHCRAGIGRTGIIAAGVLLHCGFEPQEAIEHISKLQGVQVPDTQEQIDWVVKSYAAMPGT